MVSSPKSRVPPAVCCTSLCRRSPRLLGVRSVAEWCLENPGRCNSYAGGNRPTATAGTQPIAAEPKRRAFERQLDMKPHRTVAGATRPGRTRREVVDNCRRIEVSQILTRFGPPVFDSDSGVYVCRTGTSYRLIMRSSAQKLGGIRWWFVCPYLRWALWFSLLATLACHGRTALPHMLGAELSISARVTLKVGVRGINALNDPQLISGPKSFGNSKWNHTGRLPERHGPGGRVERWLTTAGALKSVKSSRGLALRSSTAIRVYMCAGPERATAWSCVRPRRNSAAYDGGSCARTCDERCGFLFSPRSLATAELRCRTCWGLSYRSQLG